MALTKLRDEVSLDGTFETITATEFNRNVSGILQGVALGKVYVITKGGEAVGVLSRVPGVKLRQTVSDEGEVGYGL